MKDIILHFYFTITNALVFIYLINNWIDGKHEFLVMLGMAVSAIGFILSMFAFIYLTIKQDSKQ